MIEFDPNLKKQPKTPVWATYIPSRSPEWKLHSNRGHAVNAISNRASGYGLGSEGIIYEYVDGEWVEWDRYERPKNCAHCGGDFRSADGKSGSWWSTAYRLRYHDLKMYTYRQPVVCGQCYEDHFAYGVENWKENQALCGKVDLGAEISG